MHVKPVFRLDTIQRHFRFARILWTRGTVGDGHGYSAKLSIAMGPRIFGWWREGRHSWFLWLLCVRLHYCRSYGGIMV